jgi:hypothetical protein
MADDIKEYYNIKDDLSEFTKNFFSQIKNIGSKFDKKFNYLSELSATIVSESMIVQDMSNEMKGIVYEPIRAMFRDHIIDEGFHANYFATIFKILWPQFSNIEKEIMGLNLCESILILEKPRVDIHYYSLGKLGFDREYIKKCINETFGNNSNLKNKNVNKRMSQILILLEKCGVFKIPSIQKEFKAQKLV